MVYFQSMSVGKIKYSSMYYFVFYFFTSLCVGVFIRDIPGQPLLFSTIENFFSSPEVKKLGDASSFTLGALDIYYNGWIQPENQWLVKLWPPGFMVTEGSILKIFGIDAPFIFVLLLINSSLVAIMLVLMRLNLLTVCSSSLAMLLPLIPFLFPVVRMFLLEPSGIILGEGFSIALFMISMLLMPLAIKDKSLKCSMLSGVTLALAAYFRSQFELIVSVLTLMAILCGIAYLLFFKMRMNKVDQLYMAGVIKRIAIILLITNAVMMPWRIHNLYEPSTGNLSWVQTQTLVFTNAGRTDNDLIENGGGWIVKGGGNIACKLERNYCGKSDKTEFYKTFIRHPIDWAMYKYNILPNYWFSSLQNWTSADTPATTIDKMINSVILFFCVANIFLLIRMRRHHDFPIYFWQCFSFYSCSFIIFILVHFEVRYFYSLKIYVIFMFLLFFPNACRCSRPMINSLQSKQITWFRYE